jgi:hypothetical protein
MRPTREQIFEEMTKLKNDGKGTHKYLKNDLGMSQAEIREIQMAHLHHRRDVEEDNAPKD